MFHVIKLDARFLCMCTVALVSVCVSGTDCCGLRVHPSPGNKVIDLGARHKAAVGIQKPENSKKKIADQKVISLIRKQYCFWAVLGYLPTPLQRGWFPLYVLCLAFWCQTDLLFCVSYAKNRCSFFCTCMVSAVFVCVSRIDCCDLRVPPPLIPEIKWLIRVPETKAAAVFRNRWICIEWFQLIILCLML